MGPTTALLFRSKNRVHSHTVELLNRHCEHGGNVLEFGVYHGDSIRFWDKNLAKNVEWQIFGFDTFAGLTEEWTGSALRPEDFDMKGQLPSIGARTQLIVGDCQKTLPEFLKQGKAKQIKLIHLDMDTYTPTKFVLNQLNRLIDDDTLILFDELHSYSGWRHHEFKAMSEFQEECGIKFKFLCFGPRQGLARVERDSF